MLDKRLAIRVCAELLAASNCSASCPLAKVFAEQGADQQALTTVLCLQYLPVPAFNIINGGSHAGNALAMQEFMILPTGWVLIGPCSRAQEVCQLLACTHALKTSSPPDVRLSLRQQLHVCLLRPVSGKPLLTLAGDVKFLSTAYDGVDRLLTRLVPPMLLFYCPQGVILL